MDNLPFVSVVIPILNEEKFIATCLTSIVASDYIKDKLEILCVDGISSDRTREIINEFIKKYSFIQLLDNPKRIVPCAMNIGIKNAKGDIIIRMDAHTEYPKDYISKTIYWIKKTNADNVGGICITKPGINTLTAKAIALSLSSFFGVGNSYFRIGVRKPKYVDTVPFGTYKKEVFNKIGLFDEELARNEDEEFNYRLIKSGGRVLLVPEIVSFYYARTSLLGLFKMYFQYGFWKVRVFQKHNKIISLRHIISSIFILFLLGSGILSLIANNSFYFLIIFTPYIILNLFFSLWSARKNLLVLFLLPFCFLTIHLSYGFGFLSGLWRWRRYGFRFFYNQRHSRT